MRAVVAEPSFYEQGGAYFRGIWAQAGSTPEGQHTILRTLAPHPDGLPRDDLARASGLAPDDFARALAALQRHDVVTCADTPCRFTVELMRRWVAARPH